MTSFRRPSLVPSKVCTPEELEADRQESMAHFRRQRMQEPLEEYLGHFEQAKDILDELIESTVDLSQLQERALEIIVNKNLIDGFRYLAGPPISIDDLKTLADTNSLSRKTLQENPDLLQRLVDAIRDGLDHRRFPWVADQRDPSPGERETAIVATAALIATRRTETGRRTEGKQEQEERVRRVLLDFGFAEVAIPTGVIRTMSEAPNPGEFCREVILGERKADVVIGLWDQRIMPIECKVSNSSTNSVKRLNNDAAVKAVSWLQDFGARQVVPAATLSGVYKLRNLLQAQERGLTLYWAHRLNDLTEWIQQTRKK